MIDIKNIHYIDVDLMRKMCHPIAMALFDSKNDPMANFMEHECPLLESALNNPRQTFGGKDLYPSFLNKSAILYYGMIKNHPFKNGNKRTATATLLVFLFINHFWISGFAKEIENYLVELAKRVANSKGADNKDNLLFEIEIWLSEHIVYQNNKH